MCTTRVINEILKVFFFPAELGHPTLCRAEVTLFAEVTTSTDDIVEVITSTVIIAEVIVNVSKNIKHQKINLFSLILKWIGSF